MVRITQIGKDTCGLTNRESEGVYCEFEDQSYSGFLSWKSLKQLVALKSSQLAPEAETISLSDDDRAVS